MTTVDIIRGPVRAYVATAGTAHGDIADTPVNPWELVAHKDNRTTEDGVTVTFERSFEEQMVDELTAPLEAYPTAENVTINLKTLSMTAAAFSRAMDDAIVTDTAASSGVGGIKHLELYRGNELKEFALYVRGPSPELDGGYGGYWLPRCYISAVGNIQHRKSGGVMLDITFRGLYHETHKLGRYLVGDALPL